MPLTGALLVWSIAARFGLRAALVATLVVPLVVARAEVKFTRARGVFDVAKLEERFATTGAWIDRHLPANAIVLASWQTGAVRYHGRRTSIDWAALDPAWLTRAIAFVQAEGYEPYVLVERWEEARFRERFDSADAGRLDWPPVFDMWGKVRIFRVADRPRSFAGESVRTEFAK